MNHLKPGHLLLAAAALSAPGTVAAQDPFEIQVYEYETVPKGRWDLETHFNYIFRGTTAPEGTVAPTQHQTHLTFELTRGITANFEMAGYLVLAYRPGAGADVVGYRFRPRVAVPRTWHWPVDVSLAAEVGFPKKQFEAASSTLEIRPIIEKRFGPWQVDLNPVLGRAISGPGSDDGWDFEPGVRIGVTTSPKLDLSLEYYGAVGPVDGWLPRAEQVHQFFLGWDYQVGQNIIWNVGIGRGMTDAGNKSVFKMRLGWLF